MANFLLSFSSHYLAAALVVFFELCRSFDFTKVSTTKTTLRVNKSRNQHNFEFRMSQEKSLKKNAENFLKIISSLKRNLER